MTRRPERVEFDAASRELREMLLEWDPLGVVGVDLHRPEDEYDCLIPQVYARLRAKMSEAELLGFIEQELVAHLGVTPRPDDDRAFVHKLLAW
jgi:hypothetical protein